VIDGFYPNDTNEICCVFSTALCPTHLTARHNKRKLDMTRLLSLIAFAVAVAWMFNEPSYEPFIGIVTTLALLMRDEIHGFIGTTCISLNPRRGVIKSLPFNGYSFVEDRWINPLIIDDLSGWLSDVGDQVVAIDINGANRSNRYFYDELLIDKEVAPPRVTVHHKTESFSYQYVGCSFTGVHILQTWAYGSGSGVFCNLVFVTLTNDISVNFEPSSIERTERLIIKKIASIPLGDRYDGRVLYKWGVLSIGSCTSFQSIWKSRQLLLVL
jgi:hypothetical protein